MTPRCVPIPIAIGLLVGLLSLSSRHRGRQPAPQMQAGATQPKQAPAANQPQTYLGFDRNDYPGDASIALLKAEFSFAGYWLNPPPGETSDSWLGKRSILQQQGFGFLILFNGRLDRDLKSPARAAALGKNDAAAATKAASSEGFPRGTIIFLDEEEGGRLLPEQNAYVFAWIDAVIASGFKAGVYCSGIPAPDGPGRTIITADDIKQHAAGREIAFFVYNDACPPSPGCVHSPKPPLPSASGVDFASAWQFSQSPRRPQYSRACRSTYAPDGNCYPSPQTAAGSIYVDFDSAFSPDPSHART